MWVNQYELEKQMDKVVEILSEVKSTIDSILNDKKFNGDNNSSILLCNDYKLKSSLSDIMRNMTRCIDHVNSTSSNNIVEEEYEQSGDNIEF
jgi:hypothetical protein